MAARKLFGLNRWLREWLRETGWRKSAKVNCLVLLFSSVVLTALSIAALARGSLKPIFIYGADCDSGKVAAVNFALHLLINIGSTLVLASSNFFMQVLNAPTREEVDNAHSKFSWLGIGVLSFRNAFGVSTFKTWSYVSLLVSSVPIHLLFNSAVFEVDRRESNYHLTIATEKFLYGGDFYPPGSSLTIPGVASLDDSALREWGSSLDSFYPYVYGSPIHRTDYENDFSPVVSNISTIAKTAAGWDRLEVAECFAEYVDCGGLKKHRNVVLVVDNPDGWVWDDIWHLNKTETDFWKNYIPAKTPNHLFFDAQCVMVAESYLHSGASCFNTCAGALGSSTVENNDWKYPFFESYGLFLVNGTETDLYTDEYDAYGDGYNATNTGLRWRRSPFHTMTSGLQHGAFDLRISYCRAEPLGSICQLAVSPILFLGVTLFVIAKSITAVVVTVVLNRTEHKPLVTLGDAVASFIEHPDPVTVGFCTLDQKDIRNAMRRRHAYLLPGPRPWIASKRLWGAAVPSSTWLTSYALFSGGITICAVSLHEGLSANFSGGLGGFLASENNSFIPLPFTLIQGVLLANSPQLILSFCYFAYNNIFTRLQAAKEWEGLGEGYKPLRVTEPRGQQHSTYRLQLPYKYSIPLVGASAFLHWLVSNTIYVFVSTGGYFNTFYFTQSGGGGDPSLPENTKVAVGYSLVSLLVLISVASVLVIIPLISSFRRVSPNITRPGSNSLAISAACHSSALTRAGKKSRGPTSDTPIETRCSADMGIDSRIQHSERKIKLGLHQEIRSRLSENGMGGQADSNADDDDNDNDKSNPLRKLAQNRIRWGVISMPAEWHDGYDHASSVEHFGFGVEEDSRSDPVPGHMYA
ncbi:hypothetical protein F5Y03DRAFT_377894 [Xylaria venustula]|nr:hypothetical protein F5Y03DRAFT_377894 [Xylaria venustula]